MRISKTPIFVALLLIVSSLAGCGSSSPESTDNSVTSQESVAPGTASQLPFKIEGIKEEVCTSGPGYFFLDFQIKNISNSRLQYSDLENLGLEVLLIDEAGGVLATLPVSFYGALTPGLNVTIEPNSTGTLTVANDGFKGTLANIEVRLNDATIYEAPADFPTFSGGRNLVIKDGLCS